MSLLLSVTEVNTCAGGLLSSGWQGCYYNHDQLTVFKKKKKAGNSSLHFLQSMCEETESLLLNGILFCSSWDLINKTVPKREGTLFLHLIFTGFPYSPLASIYYMALRVSFKKCQVHPSLLLENPINLELVSSLLANCYNWSYTAIISDHTGCIQGRLSALKVDKQWKMWVRHVRLFALILQADLRLWMYSGIDLLPLFTTFLCDFYHYPLFHCIFNE